MASDESKTQELTADYANGSEQHQFKHEIGQAPDKMTTDERVAYLATLRSSVVKLQDEINAFLTKKMEEDNAVNGQAKNLDDKKEEENYGEEVVDDS